MNTLSQRPLVASIGVVVIALLSLQIGAVITGHPAENTGPALLAYIVPIIVACAGLWWLKLTSLLSPAGFRPASMVRLGWPILTVSMVFFAVNLVFMKEPTAEESAGSIKRLVFLVLIMAATAFFEEVIFRGIVQHILISNPDITYSRAVIVSAILFALAHLANLIHSPEMIIATSSQVLYAFALGVFLSSLMLRTRNLWLPIIGHFIFNVLGSFTSVFTLPDTPASDIPIFAGILQLVLISPLLIIGLRWLKKDHS
ncbi:CAAX amino terminal protease self- immunity [Corynebacterium ciconiae DSM 44920]|uniref:CPBP family intramembrane glutamic endopeptidase n=1 Tax=Corynebacterium ciconiae TaxID=227319 RepID=UPI000373C137|nr:type II CAAX endopeptidase family protein [Corynebacterium ciconiae]WKD60587.1 CAAX amino terminal protease self- immunity [Corynebacterium ciconiae DSM 44920]